jgi:hypothetical protein
MSSSPKKSPNLRGGGIFDNRGTRSSRRSKAATSSEMDQGTRGEAGSQSGGGVWPRVGKATIKLRTAKDAKNGSKDGL